MFKSILVLESAWDSDTVKSKSVWPFIKEFANVWGIDAYHQIFTDKKSFEHWIETYDAESFSGPKMLYIASHGSNKRICGLTSDINAISLDLALAACESIQHVHFGSCWYGNDENLELLLKLGDSFKTVTGYSESVDWIDSTLADILLWNKIIGKADGARSHTVVKEFINKNPDLYENLGFNFYYKYGDKFKNVKE